MCKKEINGNFEDIYFSIKSIQTELCSIKERLRNLNKLGLDTDEEIEVLNGIALQVARLNVKTNKKFKKWRAIEGGNWS